VKHWACASFGSGVSCVCGVAMREGDTILVADMCYNDSAITEDPKYVTYNAKNLPDDAGITVSNSGRTFKVSRIIMLTRFFVGLKRVLRKKETKNIVLLLLLLLLLLVLQTVRASDSL